VWATLAEQSDKEGWPAARFLAALADDCGRRRIERHLTEAKLPAGKALDNFDFDAVPMVSKAKVMAPTAGDSWLEKGANLLLFGPARRPKPSGVRHRARARREWLACAVHAHQRSRPAPADRAPRVALESAIAKLDKYHLLILDDIAYVSKDQAENKRAVRTHWPPLRNGVRCCSLPISRSAKGLLELERYERRALSRRRRAIEMFDGLRMMSDAARKVVGSPASSDQVG
jgi:hypothetical protein